MAENYSSKVLNLIRTTTNTKEGMNMVVESAEYAITAIDQDIADLLAQRNDLVTIYDQYITLYKILLGEELRDRMQIARMSQPPMGAIGTENIRQRVLFHADHLKLTNTDVTEGRIVADIRLEFDKLPWKNPNAVVATILTRSGRWQKNESGTWEKIEEEAG